MARAGPVSDTPWRKSGLPSITPSDKRRPSCADHGMSGERTREASAMAGAGWRRQVRTCSRHSPARSRFAASDGSPETGSPARAKASRTNGT